MSIKINKDEFQAIVNLLEDNNTFKNRTALWKAVEETEWAKSLTPIPLKATNAYINAFKLGIVCKTPEVKKPRKIKQDIPVNTEFPTLIATEPSKPAIIKNLRAKPVKFYKNKVHVPTTNLKQAVINKCMDCSGNNRENVASCHVKSCPLYAVRPYKLDSASKETENV